MPKLGRFCGTCGADDWKWKQDRWRCRPCCQGYIYKWRLLLRLEAIVAYGDCCACCGETEEMFLTFDHIDGDGASHRFKIGTTPSALLVSLKREGWPENKIQLLCWNCNCGRYKNGGTCPHKQG